MFNFFCEYHAFDGTSASAGFPANDWEITINDLAKIVVTSSLGQVIYDFPLTTFGEEGTLDLSKSNLQSAIYYYTLYVDGKKIDTKRLVTK
ncbi:hypothetical protein [Xanthomarina gelatinilytica]|uniref:hypothetical protein n=1 Tax=Xanthomarina gelatinilytica TaxID=1137281 RepID=UPI003AA937A6